MTKRLKNFLKNHYLFIIIIGLAAVLRLYRLPEMVYFDFDQEYAANFAYRVIKEFPVQLIGQGLSVQGLFMGPLYFYFLTPFFLIFNLHPLGGAVGSIFIGLITIAAYYFAGNRVFGSPAGLILAFLRAVLYRRIDDDWSMTPALNADLIVILTWFFFYLYWKGENKFLPLLGLIFGLYSSFHPIFFPFYFVFLTIFLIRKPLPKLKLILISGLPFLLPIAPLILFEFFHKFMEINALFGTFSLAETGAKISFSKKMIDLLTIIMSGPNYIFSLNLPALSISLLTVISLCFFTFKKIAFGKDRFHLFFLILTIIIFMIYYLFLPVNILGYYLGAPIVLLLFYFGGFLGYLATKPVLKWVIAGFLIYAVFVNLKMLQNRWSNANTTALIHKDKIVKSIIERQPSNKDFFVSYISSPGWNFGFNYLFKIYGRIPEKDYVPNYSYTIVIPKNLSPDSINISSGDVGLILPQ